MTNNESLKWFLQDLAAQDDDDIESNDLEIMGEDEEGRDAYATVKINELASDALDRIKELESQIADKGKQEGWVSGLPCKVGHYWLHSYRYGKGSIGRPVEKEFTLIEVVKISNGILIQGDGAAVYKSEVEEPYYVKAILPSPPGAE